MTDESRQRDTMHAPPFEPDEDDDSLDDGESTVLPPFEIFPDEPVWSAKRAERDHGEREEVLSELRRNGRRLGLVTRLFDANQKAEQAFKLATEARFGLVAAETARTLARVELLREELRTARKTNRNLRVDLADLAKRHDELKASVAPFVGDGK